jgi:hypothetical protein
MASAPLQAALDSALRDEERIENILRERTRIPEEILVGGTFPSVRIRHQT